MRIEIKGTIVAMLAAAVLLAPAARGLSPADKCEASKLGTAGKYNFCRLKAEAKAVKTGGLPDFSKCDPKFSDKWAKAETNGGGMCPSNVDEAAVQAFITEHTDALEAALDGGPLPEGVLSCNADLAACTGGQPIGECLKTGQTTCWDDVGTVIPCAGTGQDGELRKGLARSYVDNGDGTITDTKTLLMWEKLSNDGTIHDYTTSYTWTNAFNTKIATLNSGNFAGHNDWRLPNRNELVSLLSVGNTVPPNIGTAFNTGCAPSCTVTTCSCTHSGFYWSSSSNTAVPSGAWCVAFINGFFNTGLGILDKSFHLYVRGVRGGS